MYSYIKGYVTEINSNNITVEANGVGFLIYVPNPFCYEIDKEYMYIIKLEKMSIVYMVLKKKMSMNYF